MRKLKLLISANSCEPDKESEPCAAVRKIDPFPFLFHCQVVLEPTSPGSIHKITPPLLLDLSTDAKILIDKENVFSREMDVLRRRLEETGAKKVILEGGNR